MELTTAKPENMKKLQELKSELDEVYSIMPQTFEDQKNRDKAAFELSREIELLENPGDYKSNKNHWDNHELRF